MRKLASLGLAIATAVIATTQVAAQQANPAWNGFYAGLNAGGMFGSTSASFAGPAGPGGFSGSGGGFVGGGQAGYNYLFGPVLLGGEIDFQGSTYAAGVNGGGSFGPLSTTERTPWFSTMRARVGYPVGSVVPYVTGGAVWGREPGGRREGGYQRRAALQKITTGEVDGHGLSRLRGKGPRTDENLGG